MTVNEMTLSAQWRTRTPEEAYWTLDDMRAAMRAQKIASVEREYPARRLIVAADSGEGDGLAIVPNGNSSPLFLNHHSFGQLAGLAGAPASYLRNLPAELAADCLTVGLAKRDRNERDVSLMANTETATVRALTGEHYSRLWGADLAEMIASARDRSGDTYVTPPAWDLDGRFRAAGLTRIAQASDVGPWTRVQAGDEIRPAGLYYSPNTGKDTFGFLINTRREIDLPRGGSGFRFLMFWNSESGAASVGMAQGIVDIVCGNHILWGLRDVKEFRFRHVGDGLSARAHRELLGAFRALDAAPWESQLLQAATAHRLGETVQEIEEGAVRATRLPLSTIQAARAAVSSRDYGAPASAYAVASALTEYAQTLRVEDRVDVDRAAGKLYSIGAPAGFTAPRATFN